MSGLAVTENTFITRGVEDDIRIDGRSCMDYRSISMDVDVVSSANGSCRLAISGEKTQLLVVVKLSVGEENSLLMGEDEGGAAGGYDGHYMDTNNLSALAGRIRCHVESGCAFGVDVRRLEEARVEFTAMMDRVLNQKDVIDLKRLSIAAGKLCWIIDIDVTIMRYGGNVVDAMFLATRAALHNLKIPSLTVEDLGAGIIDYAVDEDREDERLMIEDVPVCVTLHKIGNGYVVDACLEEELCSTARVSIAVDKRGRILAIQKGKYGAISSSIFTDMVQTARKVALKLIQKQDAFLADLEV